ncbi:glycosyltransferase [Candidatus Magnetoovum chiemensis]|nr:glycosyltransferase [Candidatus Magnetoovum chiemensis]
MKMQNDRLSQSMPIISIITPTLNQGRFIEQTIQSVLKQSYKHYEHIIIDGKSSDNTIEILRKYDHLIKWVSEKDSGQSEALNKGLKMASGDIIAWLNSDDYYYTSETLANAADAFKNNDDAKVIVGRTVFLFDKSSLQLLTENRDMEFEDMLRFWDDWVPPCQPGIFFKAELIKQCGFFDENLHYAMDLEYWLRLSKNNKFYCVPDVYAVYRLHESAKSGFAQWSSFFPEYNAVYRKHKKYSKLLPQASALCTIAIALRKDSTVWQLKELQFVLDNYKQQKIHDLEILIITDAENAQNLLNTDDMPMPVRCIKVAELTEYNLYNAIADNADGFTVHCPSSAIPLNFKWFAASLTSLILDENKLVSFDKMLLTYDHPLLLGGNVIAPDIIAKRSIIAPIKAFAFKKYENPTFSIIVKLSNNPISAFNCLYSIYETTVNSPVEVICLADGEIEEITKNVLSSIENIKVIAAEDKTALLGNLNKAVDVSVGEYIVIIEGSVMIKQPQWTEETLARTFERDSKIGIVGAMVLHPDGTIKEAGSFCFSNGARCNYGFGDEPAKAQYNFLRETDYCSLDFLSMRRDLWNACCKSDDNLNLTTYLDTDISFRVRQSGFKVIYQPQLKIFQFDIVNSKSYRELKDDGRFYRVGENRTGFYEKWQDTLSRLHWPLDEIFVLRGRRYGKKTEILIISKTLPLNCDNPVQLRMFNLIKSFISADCNVTYYADLDPVSTDTSEIQQMGVEFIYRERFFRDFIQNRMFQFDILWFCDKAEAYPKLDAARKFSFDGTLVFDAYDLKDIAELKQSGDNEKSAYVLQIQETILSYICNAVNAVAVYSQRQKDYILTVTPMANVFTIEDDEKYSSIVSKLSAGIKDKKQDITSLSALLTSKEMILNVFKAARRRLVYIWGAGSGGVTTYNMIADAGIDVCGFIDSNSGKWGKGLLGLTIYPPSHLVERDEASSLNSINVKPYIIIGSIFGHAIQEQLRQMGFSEGEDFSPNYLL